MDAGTVSIQLFKNNNTTSIVNSVACTAVPGAAWQTLAIANSTLAPNDELDLALTALATACA